MEIISPAYDPALAILKRFRKRSPRGRLMKYCARLPVAEGVLLLNLLTRELVLLTEEEYAGLTQQEYLWERWFVVPEQTDEKELADFVRLVLVSRRKKSGPITRYTIYTTTDCNARCFYCFQKDRSRIPMSQETAEKIAAYIIDHCGGKPVKFTWFGGEPLYNAAVIDTICAGLRRAGIEYTSYMMTNGYLFDDEMVARAAGLWNLRNVQITLDGTEAVYNRAKAYIYPEGNPYQVVLANIGRLLDASVAVAVRLNMDLYNAGDLMELVDELARRFRGKKGLHIYAHYLFREDTPSAQLHSAQGWEARDQALARLTERIAQLGLASGAGIRRTLKANYCMADSGNSVTIAPTGEIGLCDRYSDSEFIGHIDREDFDQAAVESWRETLEPFAECPDCFHYPECWRLKKCPTSNNCFPQQRNLLLRICQRQMAAEYDHWKNQTGPEELPDPELCD